MTTTFNPQDNHQPSGELSPELEAQIQKLEQISRGTYVKPAVDPITGLPVVDPETLRQEAAEAADNK